MLRLTHSGKIVHTDFSGNSLPPYMGSSTSGTGAVTMMQTGLLRCVTVNNADVAYWYYNEAIEAPRPIIRVRSWIATCGAGHRIHACSCVDSATAPSGAIVTDEPSMYYNGTGPVQDSYYNANALWGAGSAITVPGAAYYVHEMYWDSTNVYTTARNCRSMASIVTGSWAFAYANQPWVCGGDTSNSYQGDIYFDWFQMFESFDITVDNLPSGYAVRLYDQFDNVMASAVEAGGTATLDVTLCNFALTDPEGGFRGYYKVFTDGTYATEVERCPESGTVRNIWGGNEYEYESGKTARFVDLRFSRFGGLDGEIILDINDGTDYCIDEIEYPAPRPRPEYRDPAHGDGRNVSHSKWENREVTVKMQVFGSDEDDLSENVRTLWDPFLEKNLVLEWRPEGWTKSMYFDLVSPPLEINTPDWFQTWLRENGKIHVLPNVEIKLEAQPGIRKAQGEIIVSEYLGPNDLFAYWAGNDPHDWVVTEVNAGTVTAAAGCDLTTTAAGADVAAITDLNYIYVDATKHYCFKLFMSEISGATALDVDVACYDSLNNLLGTLNMLVAYNGTGAVEDPIEKSASTGVIHPASSGDTYAFPVGTVKVKRTIRNDAAVASVARIVFASFSQSEPFNAVATIGGLHANRTTNPASLYLPSIETDLPAPARVYIGDARLPNVGTGDSEIWRNTIGTTESGGSQILLYKLYNAGASTASPYCLDQLYYTGPSWTGYIDLDYFSQRRYYVVARVREMHAGADNELQVTVRFYDKNTRSELLGTGVVTPYAASSSGSGRFHTSGSYIDSDDYFESLGIVDVIPSSLPVGTRMSDLCMRLYISGESVDANYYDWVALIPVDDFANTMNLVTFFVRVMVDDKVYYTTAYARMPDSTFVADELNTLANLPLNLYPNGTSILHFTQGAVLTSEATISPGYYYRLKNISIFYDQLFLLIQEE